MRVKGLVIFGVLVGSFSHTACKRDFNDADVEQADSRKTLTYGHQGVQLPLTWNIAGTTDPQCAKSLQVPPELVDDLHVAWSEANRLLGVNMERIGNQNDGDFHLDNVSILVGNERVLLLNGCINGRAKEAAELPKASGTVPVNNTTPGAMLSTSCGQSSPEVAQLKAVAISPAVNCPQELMAGFAMRTSNRQIAITAYFRVKGVTYSYSAQPFDVDTIEVSGNANASITTFGAAILPLPPPAKAAATALLDRIGSATFSASFASINTVVPDRAYTRANFPDGPGTMHVSKLAQKIARGILRPICRDAHPKIGGYRVEDCDLRETYLYPGSAETLEKYKIMPVKHCIRKDVFQSYLYAVAPKADKSKEEVDFLVRGSNPSKVSIYYEENNGGVKTLKYASWGTFQGEVTPSRDKCPGGVPIGSRCISVLSGAKWVWPFGGGADCVSINTQQRKIAISLATSKTMSAK